MSFRNLEKILLLPTIFVGLISGLGFWSWFGSPVYTLPKFPMARQIASGQPIPEGEKVILTPKEPGNSGVFILEPVIRNDKSFLFWSRENVSGGELVAIETVGGDVTITKSGQQVDMFCFGKCTVYLWLKPTDSQQMARP